MRRLYYPDIDGEGRRIDCSVTPEEAVRLQRERAESLGCHYDSDEEALDDFIANNWAAWDENRAARGGYFLHHTSRVLATLRVVQQAKPRYIHTGFRVVASAVVRDWEPGAVRDER